MPAICEAWVVNALDGEEAVSLETLEVLAERFYRPPGRPFDAALVRL